jgi:hypothetical protein
MIDRIERASTSSSVRFVIAGDNGAWPDPTAEAIFAQLVTQVGAIEPQPAFFVNLGDFAGPGTTERHERYLDLVAGLPFPDLCVVGNHDLDDPEGAAVYEQVHGPMNFTFALGHTRFVAIHAEPGIVGQVGVPGQDAPEGTEGPREDDLVYLDDALAAAEEPNPVVLMHMPPNMDKHYHPHPEWGFSRREDEFLAILHAHGVKLVCSAHGLAFDTHMHEGVRFVMSGGGGTGLCSDWRGICTEGDGRPEDRGALFHAVELTIGEDGAIAGRVHQAFAPRDEARIAFGADD